VLTLGFPTQQSPTRHSAPRRGLSRGAADESWYQPRGRIPARCYSFSRIRASSWRHRLLRCNSTNSQRERDQGLRSSTSGFSCQVRVRKQAGRILHSLRFGSKAGEPEKSCLRSSRQDSSWRLRRCMGHPQRTLCSLGIHSTLRPKS